MNQAKVNATSGRSDDEISEASSIPVKSDDSNDEDYSDAAKSNIEDEISDGDNSSFDMNELTLASASKLNPTGAQQKRTRSSTTSARASAARSSKSNAREQGREKTPSRQRRISAKKNNGQAPSKQPAAATRRSRRRATQRTLSNKESDSSHHETLGEEFDDESDADEKSHVNNEKDKKVKPNKRRTILLDSDEELSEDNNSNQEVETPVLKLSRPATRSRSQKRSRPESVARPTASKQRMKRKGGRTNNSSRLVDTEDDDSSIDDTNWAITPEHTPVTIRKQRSSARKAKISLSRHARLDNENSEDEEEDTAADGSETPPRKPRVTRGEKTRKFADDEDYHEEDDDEEAESEIEVESEEDSDNPKIRKRNKRRSVNIDQEQIGTVNDDSSRDEETTGKHQQFSSPGLHEISPSQKDVFVDSDSYSQDDNAHPLDSPVPSPRGKVMECPSTHDEITAEKLPKRHVCFITNDGSRHCFALSTLHRIATSSALTQYRTDVGGNLKKTFLQPPHFRSAMSEDLLDQIASRFGRQALEISSSFYGGNLHRMERMNEEDVSVDEQSRDGHSMSNDRSSLRNAIADNEDFLRQVHQYMTAQMGSHDLYACPVCFSVAQFRFRRKSFFGARCKEQENGESSNDEDLYLAEERQDPMAVLQSLDKSFSREFEIASTFCRSKVSDIKAHLRDYHDLDTRNIDGNSLYSAFKIRAQDGLLQRYLKKQRHYGRGQGAMQRYWLRGNNFYFVHLLSLVQKAQLMAMVNETGEQDEEVGADVREEAQQYWSAPIEYFSSCQRIKDALWDRIASPFRKTDALREMKEWIADENEDDGDDAIVSHRSLYMDSIRKDEAREAEANQELVERLRVEAEGMDDEESVVVEEEEESDVVLSEDSGSLEGDEEENESDDMDEWQQNLLNKRRARSPEDEKKSRRGNPRTRGSDVPRRRLSLSKQKQDDSDDSDISWNKDTANETKGRSPSSSGRKRRVVDDDDDDETGEMETTCYV